jgi:hypothetical protein
MFFTGLLWLQDLDIEVYVSFLGLQAYNKGKYVPVKVTKA